MKVLKLLAGLRSLLDTQTRPSFHYATDLCFHALVYGAVLAPSVYLLNVLGVPTRIDSTLLLSFLGPLGLGSLAAGAVRQAFGHDAAQKQWLVPAAYGGVSFMTFALLISFEDPSQMPLAAAFGLFSGAATFTGLAWLQRREAAR